MSQIIDNQRASNIGSNQSQEGLQSNIEKIGGKKKSQNQRFFCILQILRKNVINIIRFCCCIFLGLMLSSDISSKSYKQISNGIVASNDILLDKGLRGIFPPLQGRLDELYGSWQLTIMTSLQKSTAKFSQYSLNLKKNEVAQLTHRNCKGDIKFDWHTFYYNICFREKQKVEYKSEKNKSNQSEKQHSESQMEILNQKQDIECITTDGQFINILKNSSIWSVHFDNLYIISEVRHHQIIESKMLIFTRKIHL